jgi:lipopolysaccharide/colanic/teichoic acid biosynthesis glycosyltransferase
VDSLASPDCERVGQVRPWGGRSRREKILAALSRLCDVACAFTGLLILLPVFAGVALSILWHDGPPVLFGQIRVGWKGKLFVIWKFRTMRAGVQGRVITAAGDGRITRVGAWLRKFKLDELPQLFNVLKGDMSVIGPRPEVPTNVQFDNPLWRAVLEVRPGITDLATLIHRDEEDILGASRNPDAFYRESILPAKLYLNLVYLRSRSFWRDLRLIFLTVRYSLFPGRFDRDHVREVLGIGARIHDEEYRDPVSCPIDR